MPSIITPNHAIPATTEILKEAQKRYAGLNPTSKTYNDEALAVLPGGTTRKVIHFNPFPLVFASGDDAWVTDVDGHKYLDLCSEYSAGMFGHSHPIITAAMHKAIDNGYALGGVNIYEGKLARLVSSRFPSMEMVRFSNSGTETNMTCLNVIRSFTGKDTIIVMSGGYHGGLAGFAKGDPKAGGHRMNSPLNWVVVPYNDISALREAVEQHKDDLACILMELMQGSSGCLPVDRNFAVEARRLADETGAVLYFDEVMTSRMAPGGLQELLDIKPDITTLGKYFAGGGQNFGCFGGRADIIGILSPGHPSGVYHSGTFNNNVATMAAAVAVLEEVWTPEECKRLFDLGEWFRTELNRVSKAAGAKLRATGVGSLLSIHFTSGSVGTWDEIARHGDMVVKELFFFDMLQKGYYIAQRGMISLMTVHTREQLQGFIDAVEEWLEERKDYVRWE